MEGQLSHENQLLYWFPAGDQKTNLIIIGKGREQNLDTKAFPDKVRPLLDKTLAVDTFS